MRQTQYKHFRSLLPYFFCHCYYIIIKQNKISYFWRKGQPPLSVVVRPMQPAHYLKLCSNTGEINCNEIQTSIIDVYNKILIRCLKWRQLCENDSFVTVTAAIQAAFDVMCSQVSWPLGRHRVIFCNWSLDVSYMHCEGGHHLLLDS